MLNQFLFGKLTFAIGLGSFLLLGNIMPPDLACLVAIMLAGIFTALTWPRRRT